MVALTAALAAAAGCGSSTAGTGGAGGGTSSSSSSSTATVGSGGSGGNPNGLPEGKCRHGSDCKGGAQCLPPGQAMPCGTCFNGPDECGSDSECTATGPTAICDPVPCACSGQKHCVAGCSANTDCEPGKSCGADHRCAPSECAQQLDCPTNFVCPPIMQPKCERRKCSVDPECDVGYCVEGSCFDVPGTCILPAP
ncbi:MAG: hypothetical protein QM820_14215 [Minicystis sp.]